MTSPVPQEVADPFLNTMSGAVVAQQESPCIMRIGVVTAIMEGSQITVRISGSPVLINCSYLFGQYYPLLGDRVVLFKQDSQWFCIGQMSGTISSNNPLPNSSFEEGAIAAIPTGWSIVVGATGAGTPTFEVAAPGSTNISGIHSADFGTDSVGAGTSTADVYSPTVATIEGTHWTAAYWINTVFLGSVPPTFSTIQLWIQFLDSTSTVIVEYMVNALSFFTSVSDPIYRRLSLTLFPDGFVVAPTNTASVRIRFNGSFALPAASFATFYLDNVILRQVD